jgi:hypothetical protein
VMRNYIELFAVDARFVLNGDPLQGTDTRSIIHTGDDEPDDPLGLDQQIDALIAFLRNSDPGWDFDRLQDYLTDDPVDHSMRYFLTLDKDHLIYILAITSSIWAFHWQDFLDRGIVTIDSPRKTWSHGE